MKHIIISLMISALAVAQAAAADKPSEPTGWPQVNGPFGNYNPAKYGHKLVDDLNQARLVWISETTDLGSAKQAILRTTFGPKDKYHLGNWAGVIVAEGKVFASSYRPVKDYYRIPVEGNPSGPHGKAPDKFQKTEDGKYYLLNMDAEDITVAIDDKTGQTLWLAAEPGGLLRGGGKRLEFQVAPAYHGGRVFSMGSTGRIFAYDAATGKKLWQTEIPAHKEWEGIRQELLELLKNGKWTAGKRIISRAASSLVVAKTGSDAAVLVVTLFDAKGSVRGLDVATGKTLWEVPEVTAPTATPVVWRHAGREYILGATGSDWYHDKPLTGKMRLIAPKDGQVLWTVEGLSNNDFALAPSAKRVLVNVGSKTRYGPEGRELPMPWMLFGCYEISPEGAKLVWTMPDESAFWYEGIGDAADWRKYLIHDGKVHYTSCSRSWAEDTVYNSYFILDEKTGEVLFRQRLGSGVQAPAGHMKYVLEDRLIHCFDASHGTRQTWQMWTTDPKDLRPMGGAWAIPNNITSGYEVFIEMPYVDGRIFVRTEAGGVVCYDLRKP